MARPLDTIEGLPEWAKLTITLLIGAGGARLLGVWLENRRLANKDYRDTLLGRIRELDERVDRLLQQEGDLRVRIAHLEDENAKLRWKIEHGWVVRPKPPEGDRT